MSPGKEMSERPTEESVLTPVPMKVEPQATTPSQNDDGLDIPAFLRRT